MTERSVPANIDNLCKRIDEYSAILNSGLNLIEINKNALKYSKKDLSDKKTKQFTIDKMIG